MFLLDYYARIYPCLSGVRIYTYLHTAYSWNSCTIIDDTLEPNWLYLSLTFDFKLIDSWSREYALIALILVICCVHFVQAILTVKCL